MDTKTTTYTQWNLFRNCRRAAYWRYVAEMVPVARDDRPLRLGSAVHRALEIHHSMLSPDAFRLAAVHAAIDADYPGEAMGCVADPHAHADWHYAHAMMTAYADRWPDDRDIFDVLYLEKTFSGQIVNPDTGSASRSFHLSGKVDGVVQRRDTCGLWLLEHKTASIVDGDYVAKLWADMQITLYAGYMSGVLNRPVEGIIYNVLVKPKLQQSLGETEAEFEERRAALLAKSKTGKTTATRKMAETDQEFRARLAEWFAEKDRFLRVELLFSPQDFHDLQAELWELTQSFLYARRRGVWYQNTDYCFRFGRPCPYWAICSSRNNPLVLETQYERKAAHEELTDGGSAGESEVKETF